MAETTCAACDAKLDANAIAVTIGGHAVEVCCADCAQKLREADGTAVMDAKAFLAGQTSANGGVRR